MTISAAALGRDLYKRNENAWLLFVADETGKQVPGQDCAIGTLQYQCEVSGTLNLTNLGVTSLSIGVLCTTGCVPGFSAHDVRADLDHAVVTISDPVPPGAPTATGPLTQKSWHSGSVTLNLSSTDTVGIARVQVDSAAGITLAGATEQCDYTYTTPCPQATAVPLRIDTRQLPDGIDTLTLGATDAAQNTTRSTVDVMIANQPPAPPVLSDSPAGPTTRAITARLAPGGVPVRSLVWTLCAATCGPAHSLAVPPSAGTVTFTAAVPGDGAYSIQAYTIDAAGHQSVVAAHPFAVGSPAVTLSSGSGAEVALPGAVGHRSVRLLLSMRRVPHRRLELDVRTRPRRSGHLRVRLTFAGHAPARHRLTLRRGAASLLVGIPNAATSLAVVVAGFGTQTAADVRLATGHRRS